ncbi:MAG TPA: hypothetical protein VF137_08310 [Candidatus Dormibacteraeota bacterium]
MNPSAAVTTSLRAKVAALSSPRGLVAPAAWVALALALALAGIPLEHLAHFGVRNSDNATPVLQASAVLHGNWTLRGWILPQDTFLTSEVPFFIPAVALRGIAGGLVYTVPTALYLGSALLAAWTAGRGSTVRGGLAGAWVVAILLVAVPGLWGYAVLAPGIAHIGAVWAPLLVFNAVAGEGRQLVRALGAGLLIAFTALGDPLIVVLGAAPLLLCGLAELVAGRGGWPALAGGLGLAGFELGEKALSTLGGLQILGVPVHLALVHPRSHLAQALTNANFLLAPFGPSGVAATVSAALFWVLVALALGVALARYARDPAPVARLDALLPLAAVGGFLAYAGTDRSTIPLSARYLVPAAVMATIVVGRLCAAAVARGPLPAAAALAAALLIAAVRLGGIASTLQQPPAPPSTVIPVLAYLEANGYQRGYAPYWDANYSTVESDGRLQVRPLRADAGRLAPMPWSVDRAWYEPGPASAGARFVFFREAATAAAADAAGDLGIYLDTATATFGPPAQTYHVAGYTILVWDHDISSDAHW